MDTTNFRTRISEIEIELWKHRTELKGITSLVTYCGRAAEKLKLDVAVLEQELVDLLEKAKQHGLTD